MEQTPKICAEVHSMLDLFNEDFNEPCRSSLSSDSDPPIHHVGLFPRKYPGEIVSHGGQVKRDFLQRIFDKKKLKDKSLSKKMKTPFDRKLNRTSWPIQLSKISKIKDKPIEKKKGKPNNRSLRKKKFSDPNFTKSTKTLKRKSSSTKNSEIDILDEDFVNEMFKDNKDNCFPYDPVTPQMLLDVLRDPEYLDTGATLDMIVVKLRSLKLDLNPSSDVLKDEVLYKLICAIKLGLVFEKNGYYFTSESLRVSKLSKKKVDAFWEMWSRKIKKLKCKVEH